MQQDLPNTVDQHCLLQAQCCLPKHDFSLTLTEMADPCYAAFLIDVELIVVGISLADFVLVALAMW
jgi:hypothetical protein